jgi:hypothetical protein
MNLSSSFVFLFFVSEPPTAFENQWGACITINSAPKPISTVAKP